MRIWRLSKVGAVVLALFAVSIVATVAQVDPDAGPPVYVTGLIGCEKIEPGTRGTSEAIVRRAVDGMRDQVLECQFEMDDPRVSGTAMNRFNDDVVATTPSTAITWGTMTLQGPEGAWECSYIGETERVNQGLCRGSDGYDRMVFLFRTATEEDQPADDGMGLVGLIYEGDAPPFLELPTE